MKTPYVDQFGVVHVPATVGQNSFFWEGLGFDQVPERHEFIRSVEIDLKGQRFTPEAWLKSTIHHWEKAARQRVTEMVIAPRETDPGRLADGYWDLQNSRWSARDAYARGWRSDQWVNNLFRKFAVKDRTVQNLIRARAFEQWTVWAQVGASQSATVQSYAPAS